MSASPTQTIASKNGWFGGERASGLRLSVELYALRRQGDLVVLDFGVRNLSDTPVSLLRTFSRGERDDDVSGVTLYDPSASLRYPPAESGGECVCSTDLERDVIEPGDTQLLTATFGAPSRDVRALDVRVPTVGTFTDVAIEE
ncbi:MAG: hypothetical protein GEV04_18155 [Actinophytocola sp.]|nr:hypothetical protein [Actinophytocola sp.]